jgi:hypothetical protein
MVILRREEEGGLTLLDWGEGFIGLGKSQAGFRPFHFSFERWSCCPGAMEFTLEIMGLMLFAYNEGGPCKLEAMDEVVERPIIEGEFASPVPAT